MNTHIDKYITNKYQPKQDFTSIYEELVQLILAEYAKVHPEIMKEQQKEQGFTMQKFVKTLFFIIFVLNIGNYLLTGSGSGQEMSE